MLLQGAALSRFKDTDFEFQLDALNLEKVSSLVFPSSTIFYGSLCFC